MHLRRPFDTLSMLGSVLLMSACVQASDFQCVDSAQCVKSGIQGACEASGACSFPDEDCPSGRRFGELSSTGLAGQCVPGDTSVGTEASSSSTSATGGTDTGPSSSTDDATLPTNSESSAESTLDPTAASSGTDGDETGASSCGGLSEPCCRGACDDGLLCDEDICTPCSLDIIANEHFTCSRRSDQVVACWGSDDFGQLGDGDTAHESGASEPVFVDVAAEFLSMGAFHACARAEDETVCWGRNNFGQVGAGGLFDSQP